MSDQPGKWGCVHFPSWAGGTQCVSDIASAIVREGEDPPPDPGRSQSFWDDWWGYDPEAQTNGKMNGGNGGGPGRTVAGCAVTLPVQMTQRAVCPPGYVVVHPAGQGKQCMLKSVAISCHLYKSPAKPPIKASDWRCLKRSAAVVRRLDTIAKTANRVTGKANLSRSRGKR